MSIFDTFLSLPLADVSPLPPDTNFFMSSWALVIYVLGVVALVIGILAGIKSLRRKPVETAPAPQPFEITISKTLEERFTPRDLFEGHVEDFKTLKAQHQELTDKLEALQKQMHLDLTELRSYIHERIHAVAKAADNAAQSVIILEKTQADLVVQLRASVAASHATNEAANDRINDISRSLQDQIIGLPNQIVTLLRNTKGLL